MGVQLYSVFNKEFPEWDVTDIEGKLLSSAVEAPLLAPLMDYVSASKDEYLEMMEEAAPEQIDSNFEEEWFDSQEGLAKVEAILETLKADPTALALPPEAKDWWLEHITEDLQIFRDQLKAAIEYNAKFHLSFMY